MRRSWLSMTVLALAAFASLAWAWTTARARRDSPAERLRVAEVAFKHDVLPVLTRYCGDCHADGVSKGDVSLDGFTNVTAVLKDRKLWERVLQNVRSGDMPPPKKAQPTAGERDQLVTWMESTLFPVDPRHPDPGRVTLRRLNRAEYNHTIRDLVGVDFQPAADFPQDDVGYGFDNIGDVLSLPPVLWERYLRAAEMILDEAIIVGPPAPKVRRYGPADLHGHQGNGGVATLLTNGEMDWTTQIGYRGEYVVRVHAYGDQVRSQKEKVKMGLRVDGRELQVFTVTRGRREDGTGDPRFYEHRLLLEPGEHRWGVAFLNDYYRQYTEERKDAKGRVKREPRTEDRNLHVLGVELVGPYTEEVPPLTESHRRIFFRQPKSGEEAKVGREIIERFASRAFRRPLAKDEVDRLGGLYGAARQEGESHELGVRRALTAVLVSPHFLFRGELQPEPDNPQSVHPISEYALASRLSYFLWSTMPDEELTALAAKGRLRRNLGKEVRRMLRDTRARALTDNFAAQWLQLRTLSVLTPDSQRFPEFDEALRASMRRETEALFEHIVRENRPVTEFLNADYTFLNGRLARHYGMAGVEGDAWQKVSLQGTRRSGVLTHASILTLTSNPTRTSPVKRGKWVLENILGTPPPPPPPGVPALEAKETKGTLRQRMEQHRDNPLCASCHTRMDALGFAFEHFDGIGSYRETDSGEVLETAGELAGGLRFQDHQTLTRGLAEERREEFTRCLVEKVMTYALGRGLEYYDRPAVAEVQRRLVKGEYRFGALVEAVVEAVPFQMRRGEGDHGRCQ
jgi:hypothetical protein